MGAWAVSIVLELIFSRKYSNNVLVRNVCFSNTALYEQTSRRTSPSFFFREWILDKVIWIEPSRFFSWFFAAAAAKRCALVMKVDNYLLQQLVTTIYYNIYWVVTIYMIYNRICTSNTYRGPALIICCPSFPAYIPVVPAVVLQTVICRT